MAARGDKVQWRSEHNTDYWFKGTVLYFIMPPEPPATSANTYAVVDDGTGLSPRAILVSRLHRRHK